MKTQSGISARLTAIEKMSRPELAQLWRELFGTTPPIARRTLLIRFVAYRIQEQAFVGLSKETKHRLLRLARKIAKDPDADVAGSPQIKPGTHLIRDWRGKTHRVLVLDRGFEYEGKRYDSLSQIARQITGTRWSGPLFFGLKKNPPKEALGGRRS